MERGLKEIGNVDQVEGSFVCDNSGDVILSSTPAVLATATMATIGREVVRTFEAMKAADRPITRLEFDYGTWRLFARDIGDALLLVVCQPGTDMPFLRMTIDIVASGWRKDPAAQKLLASRRAERRELIKPDNLDDASRKTWRLIDSRA
jgi:hypothetical protein